MIATTNTNGSTGQNAKQKGIQSVEKIDMRDYFAAKAMQAKFTDPNVGFGSDVIEAGAQAAYRIADAMLEERNKENLRNEPT